MSFVAPGAHAPHFGLVVWVASRNQSRGSLLRPRVCVFRNSEVTARDTLTSAPECCSGILDKLVKIGKSVYRLHMLTAQLTQLFFIEETPCDRTG